MRTPLAKRVLAPALLLGLLLPLQSAYAYILPADFLCRLLADGRKASLRDATLSLSTQAEGQSVAVEERLYLKRPQRLRRAAVGDEGAVEIVRDGQGFAGNVAEQQATGISRNLLPLLLFAAGRDLDESSSRILEGLTAVGIDPNQVSLARWLGGFAYVIGGLPWEYDKPQLWLDKATFVPVRILWPTRAQPAVVQAPVTAVSATAAAPTPAAADANGIVAEPPNVHELRFSGWIAGLPRHLEEWHEGKLVRRSDVTQVAINQSLPEALFEPHAQGGKRL